MPLIDLDDALTCHTYRQEQARKCREVAENQRLYRDDQGDEDQGTAQ